MAGIRLEFAQFGHFDSFSLIRSNTSMVGVADVDLPSPIVTGLTTMFYVDTTVIQGQTYYYKAIVLRNNERFVSDEVRCNASYFDFSKVILQIFADATSYPTYTIVDVSSYARSISNNGVSIVASGPVTPKYDQGLLYGSGYYNFTAPIPALGGEDFTFEMFMSLQSSSSTYPRLFSIGISDSPSTSGQLTVLATPSGEVYATVGVAGVEKYIGFTGDSFFIKPLTHFCIMRVAGVFYIFAGGVLKGSLSGYKTFNLSATAFKFGSDLSANLYANSIRLTNGTLYNVSGFDVPDEKFPVS